MTRRCLAIIACLTLLIVPPSMAGFCRFDQATDTIDIPGDITAGAAYTIEATVRFCSAFPSANPGLIFIEQYDGQEDKSLIAGYTAFGASVWRGPTSDVFFLSASVAKNSWHHVAIVVNGTNERLYMDGILVGSRNRSGSVANSALGQMSIGGFREPAGAMLYRDSFIGDLDAVRFSNIARYLGNSFSPPVGDFTNDGNTVLLYNFNDTPGSGTAVDSGPNGWTGSLGTGFAGATLPEIVSVTGTCRYIQTTGVVALAPINRITIETFSKPTFPRDTPQMPAAMQSVSVTVPTGFTAAQTTAMIADSANAQLTPDFTATIETSNIVAINFTGPFTINVIDNVTGQTITEVSEPFVSTGIPTLTEWGVILLGGLLMILAAITLRRRAFAAG